MVNASYFTYDGVFSGEYGLRIASFETDSMQTTEQPVAAINVVRAPKAKVFQVTGVQHDEAPTFNFTIVSDSFIQPENRREIIAWLDGRKDFKELIFHQNELEEITFNCIFTITSIRYHKGDCIGFDVQATFDSIYQRGEDLVINYTGTGTAKEISIVNNSDIPDEYIYPTVTFKTTAKLGSGEDIIIQNTTDDQGGTRKFYFKNLTVGNEVTVDNETKIITSTIDNDVLQNFCKSDDGAKMSKKNWLRLRYGKNILSINIRGTVKIVCPQYVRIGF